MAEIKHKGGWRPGAGRKPKHLKQTYIGAVSATEAWFIQEIEYEGQKVPRFMKFLMKLEELAEGHFKAEVDRDTGAEKVYWQSPDRVALMYLMDRLLGKPLEPIQHSGPDGEAIPVNIDLSQSPTDELLRFLTAKSANNSRGGK